MVNAPSLIDRFVSFNKFQMASGQGSHWLIDSKQFSFRESLFTVSQSVIVVNSAFI